MRVFDLHAEQWLPVSVEKAWTFFSSPKNLSVITPADLGFTIISNGLPDEIFKGMHIKYSVKPLFGLTVKWITEITEVDKPHWFVDVQLKGPYSLWEHRHKFIEKDGGTLVVDDIRYALPFGVAGTIAHGLVRRRLNHIFDFRRITLESLFV
jgi:ligand-binding SRPBCC domain-containing protein